MQSSLFPFRFRCLVGDRHIARSLPTQHSIEKRRHRSTYIHTCINTYMHVHTHTYIHTNINMHAFACSELDSKTRSHFDQQNRYSLINSVLFILPTLILVGWAHKEPLHRDYVLLILRPHLIF